MEKATRVEFLIVGGGPTGIGAACRLQEGRRDWRLVEGEGHFGGLASSVVDAAGFTWDLGGHVLFSHYPIFDRYMQRAIPPDRWLSHQRDSWIWIRNRFVPYPFQNNLHRLPPEDRWTCVQGLLSVVNGRVTRPPVHFGEWTVATMGEGITELFLRPYNQKVWAFDPERLGVDWMGERVAIPDLDHVLKSICLERDEVSWGPNNRFIFPVHGGTGAIWNALGEGLPPQYVTRDCWIRQIDTRRHIARSPDGRTWQYEFLINTMPLDELIRCAPDVVGPGQANPLVYSITHVVGVGIQGQPPEHMKTKHWMYFPERNSPYYRVTVFSNYSPHNVPQPGSQWSLMAEISESADKAVSASSLADDTLKAMREDGLLSPRDEICSLMTRRIEHGYPTPFLGRDAMVDPVLRRFEDLGVFSRGRFGAWKYEVGNQDHSFAQGYECANRILNRGDESFEPTLFTPHVVNAKRNP
jgi:protoporphyrinogen oxidase